MTLLCALGFALVRLLIGRLRFPEGIPRWLSGAGGVAVAYAFLAGGVVLNVLKEELPEERRSDVGAFALGAGGYAALLLLA